jgi:carbonic anhydrase
MRPFLRIIPIVGMLGFCMFPAQLAAQLHPDSALSRLKAGNARFASGKSIHPNTTAQRVRETAKGQTPFAIVLGCSDSRVPAEIVFDQGLGDLFMVRTAGQVSTYASYGSIEFAHAVLGARLLVVMGHTSCGAVAAACKPSPVPGHIVTLINAIKPAAEAAANQPGNLVENAVIENVKLQVKQLRSLEPVLASAWTSGALHIVGAVYNIETGKVTFLPREEVR